MVEGGWDGGPGGTKREAKEMNIEQDKTQVPWRQRLWRPWCAEETEAQP